MSSSHSQASDDELKKAHEPWKCGDNFRYHLPESDGDPWNSLLAPLLERDTVQCDAWVDEVQNLLIFAGLFSAVVTAFAVETYPGLQEDPVVALLAQIAANSANNTSSTSTPRLPFTPDSSTVRLNVFLFLSLILSLSSVLVGIVALQWIREHRQRDNTLTPQHLFATLHMRTEALHKWHVPQIFAALPLLLQFALVFFFAGIVQLLVEASTIVLIPVACVMGATILFLILTTVLPTTQAATLNHRRDNVPAPCPYKSPQANIFRRVVTSSKALFTLTSLISVAVSWMFRLLKLLPRRVFTSIPASDFFGSRLEQSLALLHGLRYSSWHDFDYMLPDIYNHWQTRSWRELDLAWMSLRDNYYQSICHPASWLFQHREAAHAHAQYAALYDATQGLCEEITKENFNRNANAEPALITAYHCVSRLCSPEETVVESSLIYNQYLGTLLGLGDVTPLRPFSKNLGSFGHSMFREEASFIFLSFIQEHLNSIKKTSPILTNHYAEIYFRLVGELYRQPYQMDAPLRQMDDPLKPLKQVIFNGEELYALNIYDAPEQPFTHQWALSISSYFGVLGDRTIPESTLATSFHVHPFFHGYSSNFWRQVNYEICTQTIQASTIDEIKNIFSGVGALLDECFAGQNVDDSSQRAHDKLIFKAAGVHIWNYQDKCITPSIILQDANATRTKLHHALCRFSPSFSSIMTSGTYSTSNVDHEWSEEDWWRGLFSNTTGNSPNPMDHAPGDATIDVVVHSTSL